MKKTNLKPLTISERSVSGLTMRCCSAAANLKMTIDKTAIILLTLFKSKIKKIKIIMVWRMVKRRGKTILNCMKSTC